VTQNGRGTNEKRPRDDDLAEGERQSKREKVDDDDGEEMEIDEDEEATQQGAMSGMLHRSDLYVRLFLSEAVIPPAVQQPSARLLCTNLPQEVTDDVLSVLFQQYVTSCFLKVRAGTFPDIKGFKPPMSRRHRRQVQLVPEPR